MVSSVIEEKWKVSFPFNVHPTITGVSILQEMAKQKPEIFRHLCLHGVEKEAGWTLVAVL